MVAVQNNNSLFFNFSLDITPLKSLVSETKDYLSLFKAYLFTKKTKKILQHHLAVTKENYKQIENSLVELDNFVDELKKTRSKSFVERYIMNKIVTNLIDIEYLISNKVADIYADS